MTEPRLAAVVVLAAGEGTRMRSATTPKVLHPLCGRSMLGHVVHAARGLDPEHLGVTALPGVRRRAPRSTPVAPLAQKEA